MAPQKHDPLAGLPAQKAALVAAGCPDHTAASIAAKLPAGVQAQQLEQLAALAPGFDWGMLEQLATQFGPQIISAIIRLFGAGGGNVPQPLP
jgi:hypothetical protein